MDELGKLVPEKSVGGLTRLRHAERYPRQSYDREPPRQAAPPGTVTLKKFSGTKNTDLTQYLPGIP